MTSTLELTVRCDPSFVSPDGDREVFAVIELKARRPDDAPTPKRRPLVVMLVLDTSGSMRGDPLDHVIASVEKLIGLLADGDKVGVVAFSTRAAVVAEPIALDARTRRTLVTRVQKLRVEASTNFEDALTVTTRTLPALADDERGLVVFLSDGQPNAGKVTAPELGELIAAMRPVGLCTLGFGAHHDENLLDEMARAGGGSYAFVADPEEAEGEFVRVVGAQGAILADDAVLAIAPQEGVEIEELLTSTKARFGAGGLRLPVADLVDGRPAVVVARLRVTAPREPQLLHLLDVTATARVLASSERARVTAKLAVPSSTNAHARDDAAASRVLLAQAELVRGAARRAADAGNFDAAAALVRGIMKSIEAAPFFMLGDTTPLALSYEQLVDEAVAYEKKPSLEDYAGFRKAALQVDMQVGDSALLAGAAALATRAFVGHDVGPVTAELVGTAGLLVGQRVPLHERQEITIGRVAGNELVLSDGGVSKRHARVIPKDGVHIVVDLKSTNTTRVNGHPTMRPTILKDGDTITLGQSAFRYERKGNPPPVDDGGTS